MTDPKAAPADPKGGSSGPPSAWSGRFAEPVSERVARFQASVGFDRRLLAADAAVTGEGRIDSQSLEGKLVGEIAAACARLGRDLHVLVGRDELDRSLLAGLPIRSIEEAGTLAALREAGRRLG